MFRWWFGENTAMPPKEASASVVSACWNEALAYITSIRYGRRDVEPPTMASARHAQTAVVEQRSSQEGPPSEPR